MVERGAFGYFTNGPSWIHFVVLVAGFVVWPVAYLGTRCVVDGGVSVLAASVIAGIASGGYYGLAYIYARGAPLWNLFILPGVVGEIGHGMLTTATGTVYARSFDGWLGATVAYFTVFGIVLAWHSHLGESRGKKWAEMHFPPAIVKSVREERYE